MTDDPYADDVIYVCTEGRVWRKLRTGNFEMWPSHRVHKELKLQRALFPLVGEPLIYGGETHGGGIYRVLDRKVENIDKHARYPYDNQSL